MRGTEAMKGRTGRKAGRRGPEDLTEGNEEGLRGEELVGGAVEAGQEGGEGKVE